MKISDLQDMLARFKDEHGDVPVYRDEDSTMNLTLGELCVTTADSVLDQRTLDIDVICGILKNEEEKILLIG
ncbi:MAG: hypothetical protein DRQ40_07490 [Gammaproteobacteria bacterium]|nr:MAG: hypothetical protein DRQ40_07490 [Gammaproteobacteria bacterium]